MLLDSSSSYVVNVATSKVLLFYDYLYKWLLLFIQDFMGGIIERGVHWQS